MSYYTQDFETLKEAVQGAMPYSADLTAAVLQVQTDMGASWSSVDSPEWDEMFLADMIIYCLLTTPSPLWGINTKAGVVQIVKRTVVVATFTQLSDLTWQANLPDLGLADWTRHG